MVGADVSRYTFSMSGVELFKKILGWLSVADITTMLKTEEDCLSICETIFNDRVLATKLTNIIGDDNISSEKLLENIKHNKKEIFSKLEQYPAYFEDRLKFLL